MLFPRPSRFFQRQARVRAYAKWLVLALAFPCFATVLRAETRAIILVGLAGDGAVWQDFQAEQAGWTQALEAVGVKEENLQVIVSPQASDQEAPREQFHRAVTEALAAWKTALTEKDDALLVLIGHGSTRGERYTFQNRGTRVKLEDFEPLLDLPARSFTVVITGPGGYGLAQKFRGPDRVILSSTAVETEINHTKFGTFLARELATAPEAPLIETFRKAGAATEAYYDDQSRAQTEHANLYLGAAIGLEPPFELPADSPHTAALPTWTLANLALEAPGAGSDMPVLAAAGTDPKAPSEIGSAEQRLKDLQKLPTEWDLLKDPAALDEVPYLRFRDATAEELALFNDAPAPEEYPEAGGIMLLRRVNVEVKERFAQTRSTHTRLFVRDLRIRPLLDQLYSPPMHGAGSLKILKTISPRGQVIEVEPSALAQFARSADGGLMLFAPGVEPGVIVECEIAESAPPPEYGAFYDEFAILQRQVPTLVQEFTLNTPTPDFLRVKTYGDEAHAGERAEDSQPYAHRQTWAWTKLPAQPPDEPNAPLDLQAVPRLALTSYKDWGDFVAWYQNLMRNVRIPSDLLETKARELATGLPEGDRAARIRAVYEYVNNLRYLTIVGGANSWRPRNPTTTLARQFGDCKDKANLVIALLGEMGIEARFVLVRRAAAFDREFPSFNFNHALAVVPGEKADGSDWLWLDATDPATPYGMLPPGDAGQLAMVLTGEGRDDYEFREIPHYHPGVMPSSLVEITFSEYDAQTGIAKAEVNYAPEGIEAYEWGQIMRHAEPSEVRRALAARMVAVWPEATLAEITIEAGPGTAEPAALPKFSAKMSYPIGTKENPRFPRPLWTLDRDLDSMNWSRQQPLELNGGYAQTFTQVLESQAEGLPLSTKNSGYRSSLPVKEQIPSDPVAPVYLETIYTVMDALHAESRLTINQPIVPAEKLIGTRSVLRAWVSVTDGTKKPLRDFSQKVEFPETK